LPPRCRAEGAGRRLRALLGSSIQPGSDRDVQAILNHNPPGTTFCFAAGTYRFAKAIAPKTGQRVIASSPGTILTGAKIVARFTSGTFYEDFARNLIWLRDSPAGHIVEQALCTKRGECIDTFIHSVHDESILKNRITETARSGNADVAGLDSDLADNGFVFASSKNVPYSQNSYTLANPNGLGRRYGTSSYGSRL